MVNPLAIIAARAAARIRMQNRERRIELAGPLTALSLIMDKGEWRTPEDEKAEWSLWMNELDKMYRGAE